jgi:taurine dioxygenase
MIAPKLTINALTPAIGAEIRGIDLSRPLTAAAADQIYEALLDRLVLFFRDQDLAPEAHLAFAERFGEIDRPHPAYPHVEGHANVVLLENGPDKPADTNAWHTDLTFYRQPPFASVLWAREVPQVGGDTLWANMYAAYDALPPEMRDLIEDLEAVHDFGDFRNDFLARGGIEGLNEAMARLGEAVHPVAPRHAVTGRRYLYVNEPFTRQIVGMGWPESNRLLTYLFDHIDRPEFQVRFRWRPGSLAMWDNRVTQHYAVNDYLPERRIMHRVTIVKDRRAQVGWPPAEQRTVQA